MDRGEDSGVMRREDVLLETHVEADESANIEESTPEIAAPVLAKAQRALGNRGLLAAISGNANTPWLRQWRNAVMFERAGVSADNLLSNAAMLAMMRHAREEEEEAFKLPASAGDKLPDALRAKFEAAFGHDFSHVRVHTTSSAAKASKDLHAHAFAVGSDIYFGPGEWAPGTRSGDKLLAHELTHVVQYDEGRLPTGGGVSSPTDPAEVEAYSQEQTMADAVHAMPDAGPAQHDTTESTTSVASSPASPIQRDAEGSGGGALPEEIELTLGGITLKIPLEGNENPKSITIDNPPCPIRGLTITQAEIELKDDMTVERGFLHSEMIVNEHMKIENLALEIFAEGEVNHEVPETLFKISENFQGMIALNFNEEGVSGLGKFTFEQLPLRERFSLTGGEIAVEFDTDGLLTVTGEVTGILQDVGELIFRAQFVEGLLTGHVTITPYIPLQLVEGVIIDRGTIGGIYNEKDQFELFGELGLVVGEWATGSAQVNWNTEDGSWKFDAELLQAQEFLLNEIAINNGRLHAVMEEGQLTVAEANTEFNYKQFSGTILGNMDLPATTITGVATAVLDSELPFAEGAITLNTFEATLQIESNLPTTATAVGQITANIEEQPTFQVNFEGAYDIVNEKLDGGGELSTLRELVFGSPEFVHADVAEGAQATAEITQNEITNLEGGLDFTLHDQEGEFAEGNVTGAMNASKLDGEATATTTTPIGFLNRETGPLVFQEGLTITGTVEQSTLTTITVTDGAFELQNPIEGTAGKLSGTFNGTLDATTGMVMGDGTASVMEEWPITGEWGELILLEGGEAALHVEESAIQTLHLEVPFSTILQGAQPISIIGDIVGDYNGEEKTLTGEATGTLQEAVDLPVKNDIVRILPETTATIKLTENTLESIALSLALHYIREGEELLEGTIEDGLYEHESQQLAFDGKLRLMKDLEKATQDGRFTGRLLTDSELEIGVAESDLTRIGGNAKFEIDDDTDVLLRGELTDLDIDLEEFAASGGMVLKTARELQHPAQQEEVAPGYKIRIPEGAGLEGTLEKGELPVLTMSGEFELDQLDSLLGKGAAAGQLDLNNDTYVGQVDFALVRHMVLMGEAAEAAPEAGEGTRMDGWIARLNSGSSLHVDVNADGLQLAEINGAADLVIGESVAATGTLEGSYAPGNEAGFTGAVNGIVNERIPWATGERFNSHIDVGTEVSATMANSSLESAEGALNLMYTEGTEDAILATVSGTYTKGTPFSGEGTVVVKKELLIATRGEHTLHIEAESGGNVTIANDNVERINGGICLLVKETERPILHGDFTGEYVASDGEDASMTAEGQITVLDDILVDTGEVFSVTIQKDSTAKAVMTDSALESLNGDFVAILNHNQEPLAKGTLNGEYLHSDAPTVSATGTAELLRDVDLDLTVGEYTTRVLQRTNGSFEIQDNNLQKIDGLIALAIDDNGEFLEADLTGLYEHDSGNFSGEGKITLMREVTIAEGVGDRGYGIYVLPDSTLTAIVSNEGLDQITGDLKGLVNDNEGPLLSYDANGTWTRGDPDVIAATGTAEVIAPRLLVTTQTGFELWLMPATGVEVVVGNNEVESLGGTINVEAKKGGEVFAAIALNGRYTDQDGFDGEGKATLMTFLEVGEMGEYSLWIAPGTEADLYIENGDISRIGGTINAVVREGTKDFISGAFTATYNMADKVFTGDGTAEILYDKDLAELNGQKLSLCMGTGADIGINNNELQTIGGNITLALADDSRYAEIKLEGTFDAAGGSGFSGNGTTTVVRKKVLFGDAGSAYSFWLVEGTGMTAVIAENKLTEIGGTIPFEVQDSEGPLINGAAEGKYDMATGMFDGSGEVYLGRDLHFELGGTTSIDFKKDSGGKGTVENSELRSLEGTLMCILNTDDRPLVDLTATGEYDVVSATLIKAEGTAVMLRPFELLDGLVILEGIDGSGKIEDNKLVAVGGSGTIRIPTMNEMRGNFEVDWRNDGGKDIYSGSGDLSFTLLDDPATGRKTTGTVSASYSEDDKLGIDGNIIYHMNEMISGEIGVGMDIGPGMPLDPVLSGVLDVNTPLVKGRDLFGMEIPLLPEMSIQVGGPFPIVLNIGAAAGLKMKMDPLTMQASIGVENFRPLTDNAEVPTFTAALDLNWGMTFNAMAAAWMELGLGYGPVSAGGGVRGQVDLDAPLTVNPYGLLKGGPDGFSGELGVGVGLSASVSLSIIPYVYAQISSLAAEYDFPGLTIDLGEIFSFEWGTKYLFGDTQGTESQSPEAVSMPSATNSDTKNEKAVAPAGTSASEANNVEGGPQLESGSDIAAQQNAADGGGGKMDEFKEKADQIKILAAGIGAIAFLVKLVIGVITATAGFGPIGLVVYLVYEMIFGDLTWGNIETAVDDLTSMLTTGREMLDPFLPDWWKKIEDVFTGDKPSIWDALFGGADDAMRDSVRAGDHRHAPSNMRRKMVTDMLDGWTGEADQECILEVLEFSDNNGDIRGVINNSELADWVLSDLDGAEDDGARDIFESNGIDW